MSKHGKHRSQINRRKRIKQYRGKSLPLWLDKILNFFLKECLAILFFWLFYYIVSLPDDILGKMGVLSLFSVISNLIGLLISWFVIISIEKLGHYPISGFTNLNSVSRDFDKQLADIIKIIISAILVSTGVLILYREQMGTIGELVLFYTIICIGSRLVARLIATYFAKSAILVIGLLIFFGMVLTLGLFYIVTLF